ncbi:M-phase inducer phosphatase [Entamoeba marina]
MHIHKTTPQHFGISDDTIHLSANDLTENDVENDCDDNDFIIFSSKPLKRSFTPLRTIRNDEWSPTFNRSKSRLTLPTRFGIAKTLQFDSTQDIEIVDIKNNVGCISTETVYELLHANNTQEVLLCDCRFPYEYDGGHIHKAINTWNWDIVEELLIQQYHPNTILIFYCEFSSKRGPTQANRLKQWDITSHIDDVLSYNNVYILKGGYSEFYDHYPELTTDGYIRMDDINYSDQCTNCLKIINQTHASVLHRSSTDPLC